MNIDPAQLDAAIDRALERREKPPVPPPIVRALPPPSSLEDACAIAASLTADIRLREEEHEAIEWLLRYARRST